MTEVAPLAVPSQLTIPQEPVANRPRQNSRLNLDTSLVSSNGCFEFDRVIKCGYVEKRTKTKVCRPVPLWHQSALGLLRLSPYANLHADLSLAMETHLHRPATRLPVHV